VLLQYIFCFFLIFWKEYIKKLNLIYIEYKMHLENNNNLVPTIPPDSVPDNNADFHELVMQFISDAITSGQLNPGPQSRVLVVELNEYPENMIANNNVSMIASINGRIIRIATF